MQLWVFEHGKHLNFAVSDLRVEEIHQTINYIMVHNFKDDWEIVVSITLAIKLLQYSKIANLFETFFDILVNSKNEQNYKYKDILNGLVHFLRIMV